MLMFDPGPGRFAGPMREGFVGAVCYRVALESRCPDPFLNALPVPMSCEEKIGQGSETSIASSI